MRCRRGDCQRRRAQATRRRSMGSSEVWRTDSSAARAFSRRAAAALRRWRWMRGAISGEIGPEVEVEEGAAGFEGECREIAVEGEEAVEEGPVLGGEGGWGADHRPYHTPIIGICKGRQLNESGPNRSLSERPFDRPAFPPSCSREDYAQTAIPEYQPRSHPDRTKQREWTQARYRPRPTAEVRKNRYFPPPYWVKAQPQLASSSHP